MKKNLLTVFSAIVLSQGLQAQVSAYTFTQTTGTYAPVTGTDLFGAAWNDNVSAAIPLGFSFQFNAVTYSSVTVSSNGFVTFGATAPASTNYLPVSNAAAYAGAISAFGRDLSAATATSGVTYTVTGLSPNRKFVVQWENAKRVNSDAANFQIILNETSNKVDIMYGACTTTATANTSKVQVGLRGAANTDYKNRFGGNTTAWASTTAGTANTDAVNYRNTVLPVSGLTFSWLPPSCFPTSGLANTDVSSSTATFSWTSASGTAFDVYYGPTPLATPNATTVPTATTSASSFTASGLTPSTTHAFYVRNNCGAGNVSSWSPVSSFMTLCSAPPVNSTTGNFRCGIGTMTLGATTTAGATLNWYTAPTGGGSVATGSVFTTPTISTTTNYYVSATGGITTFSAGITSASGSLSYVPLGDGLRFNATQSFTINSVDVYSNDAANGIITIELQNSGGTVLKSYTMTIPAGAGTTPVTVPINFAVAPGTGYYLVSPDGPGIILNDTGVSYPYPIGTFGSITSGYDGLFGSNSSTEYFYFFNWQVSTACESSRSVVTATVNAPLPLSLNAATAVCANVISTVSVTSTVSNFDSYIWSPATNLYTDAAATIPYAGASATVLYYKSATANTTVYSVNATNSVSGCANLATVSRSTDSPVISASATPSVFCAGSTSTLVASSVSTGTAAVGTSTTTTSTQGITPYGSNWEGSRQQYLIRASELSAANIYAGNLTSLSFSVTAQGGGAFSQSNFTIKLAHTANTALNAAYGTPTGVFTTVYGPATQALPPLGLNMYTFSTPFNWDGVSNILVDICHDNDPTANCVDCYSSNSTVTYNTTSFNSTWASYNDDAQSCGMQAAYTLTGSFDNRPNMTFGGQVLNASGAGLNWVWNPGGVTTNTNAVTPVNTGTNPSVATYTVIGTNATTTCSNSAVVSVTVNPVPSTPVAANSIQCGLGIPTASVSGGTSYKWYATPTATAAIQSGAGQTYTTSIASTTNFYVSSFNGTCESPRALLTASVTNPDAVTATSTSTAICPGQSFTLTATNTGTNNVYSYTWTATPATGSGMATSVTSATAAVTPTTAGTYNYLVTASDVVCTTTAAVQVTLNAAPNVATTNTMICAGSSAVLTATSTGIGAGTATIGTNALTDYTGGPYRQGAGTDNKAQWLFTAAELSAANIAAGNITALSFSVPAGSADIMNNFSVRIGTTSATALAATFDASSTSLVYGPSPVSAATGLNTYTFSVPFNWNGTSNIIIEVCHDVVVAGGGSTSVTRQSISNRTLYSNAAGACAQTAGTAVVYRPVVILAAQTATNVSSSMNWVWNPGAVSGNTISVSPPNTGSSPIVQMYTVTATNPVTSCTNSATSSVTVNPVPSVTVAASTSSICSGTTASLTASGATTYTWMPAGGSATVAVVSPGATTVYTVTGTSSGCSNTQTVNLNVTATPTVIASASPTVICAGATVSLTASGATTYSWMPNSSASGTTIATPTASIIYTVSGTTAGCTNTKTLNVTVNNVPTLTVTSNPTGVLCTAGASATLTASGTSTAYAWSNGASTSSIVVTPPTGPTSFTVAGTNSCGTRTAVVTVTAGVTPTVTAMTSATVSCPGNPAVLTANATPGVSFLWNTTATTASITVTPTITTAYTVTASNACGTATATVVQNVMICDGIEEVTNAGGISIYPNPANDYVSIAVPANLALANTSVEVTDALGKVVMKESINTDVTTLRITELKDGIYFFKVISNNQTVKVGKVVKH
jgi:hypothetical protein